MMDIMSVIRRPWHHVSLWLLFISCVSTQPTTLYSRSLEDYPLALCNDGTHGVYYSNGGSGRYRDFVIWLESGGDCTTVEGCQARCSNNPSRCTTNDEPSKNVNGILSDDPLLNPHFHDSFKVVLHYCSSDWHTGNRTASSETGGFFFHGKDMVVAMVEDLKEKYYLGTGDNVILTGSSAGSAGVTFDCEDVRTLLPGTQVWCIVDAFFFYPPIPTFKEDCQTTNERVEEGNELWNGGVDGFDVFSWWEDFELPLMIGIPLWDRAGIDDFYCGSSDDPDHLSSWAAGMNEWIDEVSESHPEIAMFIPGCVAHGMIYRNEYFTGVLVQDVTSYSDVVGAWIHEGRQDQAWDECDPGDPAAMCNPTCP